MPFLLDNGILQSRLKLNCHENVSLPPIEAKEVLELFIADDQPV